MKEPKETRPGADTPRRAKLEAETEKATTSIVDFSISSRIGQISAFLSSGAENGVNLRHLVGLTQLSEREVRAAIQRERLAGIPILSNNADGYFLPASPDEVNNFVRSMRHRAREIMAVANAVEQNRGVSNG